MKVSIKEISAATGFSPATISNALNRKKGVNAKTSAEIFRVAKELGYINESDITKIKLVIYKKNGLIIEDTPFFQLMIDGFEKECREYGYEMVICYLDSRNINYKDEVSRIISDSTSAVVLLGTELSNVDSVIFENAKCLLLTLDYWNANMRYNGVYINNSDSTRSAVNYLIKNGHSEIGYLKGAFRIKAFQARGDGFKTAMNKSKLTINNDYIVSLTPTMDGAYKDMCEFLSKNPKLPTAFFADNDVIALGVMKALKEFDIKIPDDVSIIGFDDIPFCEISTPRLTSLRVPKQEMGRVAVRRIAEMIKHGDNLKLKIQVCTDFIERDSVKNLREI